MSAPTPPEQPLHAARPEPWSKHAAQWQHIGGPLRPSREDSDIMWELAQPVFTEDIPAPHVIVLGVTPEVVQLPWPSTTDLVAVDKSQDMIAAVWAPNGRIRSRVQRAWWQSMPLPGAWADVIVGDGSFNALPSLGECREVFAVLATTLRPRGALIARFYVRPDTVESLDAVAADAMAGRIGSLHVLKWRIAMAMDGGPSSSVAVADIRRTFDRLFSDRTALARATGWPMHIIGTIDAYDGSDTRYTFPTRSGIAEACAGHFILEAERHGTYELGECCPTLLFRRAPRMLGAP